MTPLLGVHPEKTVIQKDTHITMLTAAVFTRARTWEQTVSIHRWMDKQIRFTHTYTRTVEYHSEIKKNEVGSFVMMCMELESVTQSELS